jgi:hypothetical protein
MSAEWGSVNNARFLVSSLGSISAATSALGNNIYNCFFTGIHSYAIVEQDGYTNQFMYRPAVFSDPLFQTVSAAAKFSQAPVILDQSWLGNLQCTITS